jgi:outer membrane protein
MTRSFQLTLVLLLFAVFAEHTPVQAQAMSDTLSLTQAISMAVANSPVVAQATAGGDAARARLGSAESLTQPQLEADASYTRVDPTVTVAFPLNGKATEFSLSPNNVYNGSLALQQSILDFGRASSQRHVAEAGITVATDRVGQAKEVVAYQTIQTYYAILTIDQNMKIEQDQLTVLQRTLGVAETREKAGTATSIDPLNIQVRISGLRNQLAMLNAARTRQVAALRRLCGLPAANHIVVRDATNPQPLTVELDTLISRATAERLEVQTARDEENAAKLAIDVARAGNNPSVGLSIVGGVKDGYPPDVNDPVLNWAGSVGLKIPILDGGRTRSMTEEAEANYRAAQARTLDAERGVRLDVEQALADLQSIDEQRTLITTQLQQAREALDISELRYTNGASTNLDVLSAQSNLEQALLQQAELNYQYQLNTYALQRAVGDRLY